MKILKDTTFTWWQVGMLKYCVLFIGIVIGANWPGIFLPYSAPLLIVGVVTGIYLGFVWYKK